jgi:tetratricopeptide (TPR) repeat protein
MNIEPEHLHEIDRYLQGELTSPERKAFEEKLKQDPILAKEVEDHRAAIFFIKAGAVHGMKKKLEGYSEFANSTRSGSSHAFKKWYVWAAAASVIFAIVITLLIPSGKVDTDKLFTAYFQAPVADRQLLRDSSVADERLQAFSAYDQGLYKKALALFERVLEEQSNDELLFYAGVSALADGQPGIAISYFTNLLNHQDTLYQWRAQWYLSLAYLKNGELAKSLSVLQLLSRQPNSYTEKANELLNDLQVPH